MLFLLALFASTFAEYTPVKIIRQEGSIDEKTAQHSYLFETENGIYEDQQGFPKDPHNLAVQGQSQFTAPNGQVISLTYTADENGYQPQGAHLPTPPPIPPAILKALKYLDTLPPEKKKDIRPEGDEQDDDPNSFLLPPI
ncbi:cuticle protein AM1274 isoform X2 [Aethina tumida]|uniref:cuticle protein AM1274 isoform X2 n=1 Tax=Aethina tumida TaxID=116153 RepID=UPI00096AEEA2|nr:cuticle protein AM1274 isoform X2 [Aethina tumida]